MSHTSPPARAQSLRVSLKLILQQTPDVNDRFARHVAVSESVKDEVRGRDWGVG
jgi:hypothetical protein